MDRARGFASRLYYALFAMAHSDLIHVGQQPGARLGTWGLAELPVVQRRHLRSGGNDRTTIRRSTMLRRARFLREVAASQQASVVDTDALRAAIEDRLRRAASAEGVRIGAVQFVDGSWQVIVIPPRPDTAASDQAALLSEIEEAFLTDFGVNIMFVPARHESA